MCYVLRTFRQNPQSRVYIQLLFSLNEYAKCKNVEIKHLNLKYKLHHQQLSSVIEFLKHIRYNQPANIDSDEIDKIITHWKNSIG